MTKRKVTTGEVARLEGRRADEYACSMPKADGHLCGHPATHRVTRLDNSSYVVCGRHLSSYQRMVADNPNRFHVVTVTRLS